MPSHEVVIVGGGPTGLAAARRLAERGVKDVVVLEREAEAGGVPRHCGHLGFGWQSHRRLWSGPRFAAELRRDMAGIDVRAGTTVLELGKGGVLRIRDGGGLGEIEARAVLIATGTRETPRAARLIGGTRPQGVVTTGALQQFVYLQGLKPFARPAIAGSEWVSFSALLTCRHLGIAPVAIIEENARTTAPRGSGLVARLAFGVPVLTGTRLAAIEGTQRVEAIDVERQGRHERIACDGVIFTGRFRPESALYAAGEIESRDHAPIIDGQFRCSDPAYFAAGNVLNPLKSSGACWRQGVAAADCIAGSLR